MNDQKQLDSLKVILSHFWAENIFALPIPTLFAIIQDIQAGEDPSPLIEAEIGRRKKS